ncbi:MAG: hypothetical protein ACKVWR_22715 [Acidimicrobiales bacterium]
MNTVTFRAPFAQLWGVLTCLYLAIGAAVATGGTGPDNPKGTPAQNAMLTAMALLQLTAAARFALLGVRLEGGEVRVRNLLRTRRVPAGEVERVELAGPGRLGEAYGRLVLRDGSTIRLDVVNPVLAHRYTSGRLAERHGPHLVAELEQALAEARVRG